MSLQGGTRTQPRLIETTAQGGRSCSIHTYAYGHAYSFCRCVNKSALWLMPNQLPSCGGCHMANSIKAINYISQDVVSPQSHLARPA